MSLRRLALVALLAVPTAAGAQTLTFASSLNNPVSAGYYVGPYGNATFVSALGQSSTLSVLCVDFLNEVYFGDHYQVNVTNLGTSSALSDTRHPGALTTYRKAAWLGSLFATTPQAGWGSLQYAEWNLFTPAQAPDDAASASYLHLADVAATHDFGAFDDAGAHYDAVNMANYWVLTDVNARGLAAGGKQEFLVDSTAPLSSVPEPGMLLLVASGLASMLAVRWVRRRA
jgi:hypothetical protein